MEQESKPPKAKKTRRPPPPLPKAPDSHPVLKKEKTYNGNYIEGDLVDDHSYLNEKNKSKSQEQFSKKSKKRKHNYSDNDMNKNEEFDNKVYNDSENQNKIHFYDNPDYVFNFNDFDTGERPEPFYDEGDNDPIFEKIRIHLSTHSFDNSPKVSPRSNSAPFNNIMKESKQEEKSMSKNIGIRQHSEAVMRIRDQQSSFKFSSDNESSEPKEKRRIRKKGRNSSNGKKKVQLNGDDE